MARPKHSDPEASALRKIETAYWSLLERTDFGNITMKALAEEAGINRNSLYYHYGNLQQIAAEAFRHVIEDEVSGRFLDALLNFPEDMGALWEDIQIAERIPKLHLYAISGSPLLRSLLRDRLLSRWFEELDIDAEHLSFDERLQIDYIVNGFIGVMGNDAVLENPMLLASFPQSPIGRAAVQTLRQLSHRCGFEATCQGEKR